MFDLSTLDQSTDLTFDVPVVFDADGNPLAGFKVVGRNSQQYRDAERALSIKAIKKMSIRKTAGDDLKTDAGATQYVEDAQSREMAMSVACVVDWYGFGKSGAAVPLTVEALTDVFSKRPTWMNAVSNAVTTDANFTQS